MNFSYVHSFGSALINIAKPHVYSAGGGEHQRNHYSGLWRSLKTLEIKYHMTQLYHYWAPQELLSQ